MDPNSYQNLLFLNKNIQSVQEQLHTDIKEEISKALLPIDSLMNIQIVSQQRNQNIKFDLFDSSSLKLFKNKIQASLKAVLSSLESNKQEESKAYLSQCIKWIYQQQILAEQMESLKNECKKNYEQINHLFTIKKQRTIEENQKDLSALTSKQAQEAILQNEQFAKYQIDKDSQKEKIEEFQTLQKKLTSFKPSTPQTCSDNSFQGNNQKLASSVPQKKETQTKPAVSLPPQNDLTYKNKIVIFVEKKDYQNYQEQFVDVSKYELCSFSKFLESFTGVSPKSFLKELNLKLKVYSQNQVSHLIFILPKYIDKNLNDEHNGELLVLLRQIKLIKPQVLTIVDYDKNDALCLQIQRGVGNSQKVKILNKLSQRDISEAVNEQIRQNQMKQDQLKEQILQQRQAILQQQAQSLENEKRQQLLFQKQGQELNEHLNNIQQNQQQIEELQKQINEINNPMLPNNYDIQQLKKKFQDDQNKRIEELKEAQAYKLKEFQRLQTNLMKYLNQVQIDSSMSDTYFSQVKDLRALLERKELQLQKVLFLIDQKDCVGLLLKLSKNLQILTSDEFQSLDAIFQGLIDLLIGPQQQQSQENQVQKLKTANLLNFISSVKEAKDLQDTELSRSIKQYVEVFELEQYFISFSKGCNDQTERIEKAKDILQSLVACESKNNE